MPIPLDFTHNRLVVALAAGTLLIIAPLAGAASMYIDRVGADYRVTLPTHHGSGLIVTVLIAGFAAGATALAFPIYHRVGKAAMAILVLAAASMIWIGSTNASAFLRMHHHTTVSGGD